MTLPTIRGVLWSLPYLRNAVTKRESSWDRTGGNRDYITIKPGDTATLAKIKGTGAIRHIWITISCPDKYYLRKILLRMYWDHENKPSVESPIGDFFGMGHGIAKHYISLPLTMTCDKGFNCYFPMPFFDYAEIEVVNECDTEVRAFYYHIDYELYDKLEDEVGLFHAKWRREKTVAQKTKVNLTGENNYLILYAEGRGHYIGCVLSVHGLRPCWWGEGDDMIFVDGEKWPPSLHGTGTEDYFCSAWGFNREYWGPYHGFPLWGKRSWLGYHTMYRFHLEEPVVFRKSIKVTIEHGHANDRADDISSVAYWYQTEPHIEFTTMPPPEERIPFPEKRTSEVLEEILEEELKKGEVEDYNRYFHYLYAVLEDELGVRGPTVSVLRFIWDLFAKLDERQKKEVLVDLYIKAISILREQGK